MAPSLSKEIMPEMPYHRTSHCKRSNGMGGGGKIPDRQDVEVLRFERVSIGFGGYEGECDQSGVGF